MPARAVPWLWRYIMSQYFNWLSSHLAHCDWFKRFRQFHMPFQSHVKSVLSEITANCENYMAEICFAMSDYSYCTSRNPTRRQWLLKLMCRQYRTVTVPCGICFVYFHINIIFSLLRIESVWLTNEYFFVLFRMEMKAKEWVTRVIDDK